MTHIHVCSPEYAELGALYDYLKEHTIDFRQIVTWGKQIALGEWKLVWVRALGLV